MTQASKVRVDNLFKIFGSTPELALKYWRERPDREWIQQETNNIVAVAGVSFDVAPGEIFVVMGLSGSGKSTLIRCLNRLVAPTSGNVFIDEEDIVQASEERLRQLRLSKFAMVFQHFALFPHRSVGENVEFGLKIKGIGRQERRERALAVLEQVGLKQWADRDVSSLSGGMQQRVGLARSLAVDPEILLMDEAFSALDPLIRREMQDELLALQRKLRKTIVFITHDLHEALILGNRVAIMKDGQFVQVASPQDIVGSPANEYVAAFTRDVDRGRIFTAERVMSRPAVLNPAETASAALRLLSGCSEGLWHVIDSEGVPVGLVSLEQLQSAAPESSVERAMTQMFPKTLPDAPLVELYRASADNLPVAVVDETGRYLGSVFPSAILRAAAGPSTASPPVRPDGERQT